MSRYEQLWAPWRLPYITGDSNRPSEAATAALQLKGADPNCFLCRAVASADDRANLVVERSGQSLVILNRFPYNNGHLLIAPLRHEGRLAALSNDELLDSQQLMARYVSLIERVMNGEGFNIGLNLGRAAGAGVPGHLHWHLVPRWSGDTNFMSATAAIRVIPQSLEALWELLREALAAGDEKQRAS